MASVCHLVEGCNIFHWFWWCWCSIARTPHLWVVPPRHAWSVVTCGVYGLICLSSAFGLAGGICVSILVARYADVRLDFVYVDGLSAACN
jgi:hypothetical protein